MNDLLGMWARHRTEVEDSWGRRRNRPRFGRQDIFWGRQVISVSNRHLGLAALDYCRPLYSRAPLEKAPPYHIQFVVQSGPKPVPDVPERLFDYIQYTGGDGWQAMHLGSWGHVFLDLEAGRAKAVLTPELAGCPDLVGRCVLNTILTNFFIADGYAMLHASCLVRGNQVLLLMAPHNTGKSTTALRLTLAGYVLLTDSMVFLSPLHSQVQLLGFSVGYLKIRRDMVDTFPQFQDKLETEHVRGEEKYALDLQDHDPGLVQERAVTPQEIVLCLLSRHEAKETLAWPATPTEVAKATVYNSIYYDTESVWRNNVLLIERLLTRARCYHLTIGTDGRAIVDSVDQVMRG